MSATLVFPSSHAAALQYARHAAARGEYTVGASSAAREEWADVFGDWEYLPSIHHPDFESALISLVERHGLTHVYVPLATAHTALLDLVESGKISLKIVRPNPIAEQLGELRASVEQVESLYPFIRTIVEEESRRPSKPFVAAVLRYASRCYGESSATKLVALLAAAASAPVGDVVEIGTLMGRSASVLIQAARYYGIGAVLTVDPWDADAALQHDSPQVIRSVVDLWDFEMLARGYFMNIIPVAWGRANHLRMPSAAAFLAYKQKMRVHTAELGETRYNGHIALLHIDGNHDVEKVHEDWSLWGSRLLPGGWVVFDDYCWLHGTGPHKVGDELLERRNVWQRAFVCDGALFLQLNP
jgi:hypothetical protein